MKWKLFGAIVLVVVLVVAGFYFFTSGEEVSNDSISRSEIRIEPLNALERNKVVDSIEKSEIVKDLPSSGAVALRFYSFDEEGRVWRDSFLVGKKGLLEGGERDIFVGMHARYIDQLDSRDLCDVVSDAKRNGDLLYRLESSKTKILLKYSGMLKYRECFGF